MCVFDKLLLPFNFFKRQSCIRCLRLDAEFIWFVALQRAESSFLLCLTWYQPVWNRSHLIRLIWWFYRSLEINSGLKPSSLLRPSILSLRQLKPEIQRSGSLSQLPQTQSFSPLVIFILSKSQMYQTPDEASVEPFDLIVFTSLSSF